MDVDPYRLAYNVLHSNWTKFGISPEDIPPPKTEKVDSLDPIIPGLSTAVVLFQIASRKDLKFFLDNECPTAHNLSDVYTRFENIMKEFLAEDTIVVDTPKDEDTSPDTMEEYLSEDSLKTDLPQGIKEGVLVDIANKDLPEESVKEDSENYVKEGLFENAMKESPNGNIIRSEDIPSIMTCSLAVCAELVLYKRENENNIEYMKYMPDMWKEYFDKNLKPLCNKARYTQNHLKDYSNSIEYSEKILNKFISVNKNEHDDIADKFCEYTKQNSAVDSSEHSELKTEFGNFSKGMSFLKIKRRFVKIKAFCKSLSKCKRRKGY